MNIVLVVSAYVGLVLCSLYVGMFVGMGTCLLWRLRKAHRGTKTREQDCGVFALALILDSDLWSVPVVLVIRACSCWFISSHEMPSFEPTLSSFTISLCLSFWEATGVKGLSDL